MTNKLYYGDNLDVLREHIASESVDLVEAEAAAVGRFESEATGKTYPRLQIITLAELFQGKKPDIPFVDPASVKRAKREETGRQERLI
ncbi:MAG: hypothetical protein ACK40O_07330 [Allosphingosinicella sp.]